MPGPQSSFFIDLTLWAANAIHRQHASTGRPRLSFVGWNRPKMHGNKYLKTEKQGYTEGPQVDDSESKLAPQRSLDSTKP